MKKAAAVMIVGLTMMALVNVAQAYTISLSPPSVPRYNNGGPFLATVYSPVPDHLIGTPAGSSIQFLTYCLETSEYFNWGTTYNFTIDNFAYRGGVSGQESLYKDPISYETAWLYEQFRTTPLPDGDHIKAYQAAFWYLEEEIALPGGSIGTYATGYITAANNAVQGGWKNDGSVVVLNLFSGNDSEKGYAQSQLALMAVPEPSTLLLIGSGLIGMAILTRRRVA